MRYFFRKERRVVRSDDFTRAIRTGSRAADGTLVVFAVRSSASQPAKLGVTIPRKVGNAVVRNRWKRLIRESFRTQQNSIPEGFQYVVRPKKGATADWNRIKESLPRLANRAAAKLT